MKSYVPFILIFTALGKPLFSKGIIVSTTDKWGKNAEVWIFN